MLPGKPETIAAVPDSMRQGTSYNTANDSPNIMPAAQLQVIVANSRSHDDNAERRSEWREAMANALQQAHKKRADWQIEG